MSLQYASGHEDLIAAHDIVRALDWPTMKPFLQEFNVTAFGVEVWVAYNNFIGSSIRNLLEKFNKVMWKRLNSLNISLVANGAVLMYFLSPVSVLLNK